MNTYGITLVTVVRTYCLLHMIYNNKNVKPDTTEIPAHKIDVYSIYLHNIQRDSFRIVKRTISQESVVFKFLGKKTDRHHLI